jgi:hypothetical protein
MNNNKELPEDNYYFDFIEWLSINHIKSFTNANYLVKKFKEDQKKNNNFKN